MTKIGKTLTRRELIASGACVAMGAAIGGSAQADAPAPAGAASVPFQGRKILCYVGGYTSYATHGVEGHGPGISMFQMDEHTGELTHITSFLDIASPSFIVLSPDRKNLYAISEIDDYNGEGGGSVTSFSVNTRTGELVKLNTVPSGGASPCYLSIHPTGKYIFVANYVGGSVAVIPVKQDGTLGLATDIVYNEGPRMPDRAQDNPSGNFAVSDHSGSHPHMIAPGPTGQWIIADDAGLDRIYLWHLDMATGKLQPGPTPYYNLTPGSGPRHFVFNQEGTLLYNLCEQNSKVIVSKFDSARGTITPIQVVSTVTPAFKGSTLAAEILIGANGKSLYVSNRLGDSIAVFSIGQDGTLMLQDEVWAHADYGRAMMFDPTDTFLFVANQRSDSVTSFRVNRQTGSLSFTHQFTAVGTPTTFAFLVTDPVS